MEDKALARCTIQYSLYWKRHFIAIIAVTMEVHVNAIQRLGWFSVNLGFKFSSVPDDIIADKRDLVVHRKLHRKS